MNLAPMDTVGSVQTTVLNRRDVGGDGETTVQAIGSTAVDSYIYAPWLVGVSGELDVAYDKTMGSTDSGSGLRTSASGTVSILPRSDYPVTLSGAHIDSRVSGDFSGSDFIRDRVSLSANAALPWKLRGGLRTSWDRTDQTDSGVRSSFDTGINLSRGFTPEEGFLGIRNVSLGATLRHNKFDATDPDQESNELTRGTFRFSTRSQPLDDVDIDTRTFGRYESFSEEDESGTELSVHGLSTLNWRPEDKPFTVTGTLRTLYEQVDETESGQERTSSTSLANGILAIRWPLSNRLSVNAGVRAGFEDVSRDEGVELGETDLETGARFEAGMLAGVNYNSPVREVMGFDWDWTAGLQVDAGFDTEEGFDNFGSHTLSQRFSRDFGEVYWVPVRFTLSQGATLSADTDDPDSLFTATLSHAVSLSHDTADRNSSRFIRLFLSDRRDFLGDTNESQTAQLRYGERIAFNRAQRLQANVNASISRQVDDDDSSFAASLAGEATYTHLELFGVRNLSLISQLRVNIVSIEDLFGVSEDEFSDSELLRNDWRNILRYGIGKLFAEAELTGFHRDEGFGYLILFRIRRDFGGTD